MSLNHLSRTTKAAIARYGFDACVEAYYQCVVVGNGASTVSCIVLTGQYQNNTRHGDSAINAGRAIVEAGIVSDARAYVEARQAK